MILLPEASSALGSAAALVALLVAVPLAVVLLGLLLITVRTVRKVEQAFPPMGRFVDVPGARLHVVERGQGPALLLVHGLAGQLGNFTYGIVDRLARSHRVVAVDRPGSGYSVRVPGASASLGAQADVLLALMDKLGLDRPVVVGHSMGGAIALALAQRHPARVRALALLAPLTHVAQVPMVFRGLLLPAWLCKLVAWTLATPIAIAKRDEALAVIFGPDPVPDDFATKGLGLLSLRPSHFLGACADLAALPEELPQIAARYSEMQLPVSILYGRGDRILDPRAQGETLAAKLPGARLTLIDGGHMLPVSHPERTARFVEEVAAAA
jgi:pimeloyl-ACP methyl ester carboxylesterase